MPEKIDLSPDSVCGELNTTSVVAAFQKDKEIIFLFADGWRITLVFSSLEAAALYFNQHWFMRDKQHRLDYDDQLVAFIRTFDGAPTPEAA